MKKHAIVLAALVASAHAHAADADADAPAGNPFYVTGAIGAAHLDTNCNVSCDSKGKGGKVIIGQNFGNGISLELGAVELGKFGGVSVAKPLTTTTTTTAASYKPIAILLGAAYTRPLGYGLGVRARLGLAQVKTKADTTATTVVVGTTTTTTVAANKTTDSKTRGYFGVGLTYTVMKDLDIELGLDSISAPVAGQGSARQLSLGATYAFGGNWGKEDDIPAQGQGFYASAAIGTSSVKASCTSGATCDTGDTGLKLLGGYQFNHGLGLEVGYLSFGKFSLTSGTGTSAVTTTAKPTALLLNGALAVPLNSDFGVKLRLGFAEVTTKSSGAASAKTEKKPKVYYGLGASYAINKNIKVEISGDSTEGDFLGGKFVTRLYSAGATYAF